MIILGALVIGSAIGIIGSFLKFPIIITGLLSAISFVVIYNII